MFDPHIVGLGPTISMSVVTLQSLSQEFGSLLLVKLLELAPDPCHSTAEPGSVKMAGQGLWVLDKDAMGAQTKAFTLDRTRLPRG